MIRLHDPAWRQTEIPDYDPDDAYNEGVCDCGSDLSHEPGCDYCICCWFEVEQARLMADLDQPEPGPERGYPTMAAMAEAMEGEA